MKKQRHGMGGWYAPRGKGRGITIVREAIAYQGDECILWPMSKDWHGYGTFGFEGGQYYAHRYVCEQVNGPAPADKPYALHSCGNGHTGCITPKHLSWGTPTQNQLDSVAHGTGRKHGEPRRKLSDADVAVIRSLKGKQTQAQMAATYNVRPETIGQILRGVARRPGPRVPGNRRFAPEVRARMVIRAKELRAAGKPWHAIAAEIDVCRLTAKSMANE